MSLNINQILPTSTPSKLPTSKTIKNTSNKHKSKTDLCSSKTYSGLFSLPNMPDFDLKSKFPNLDLPSFKFDLGINGDFLPDFTKFKINGLKLHGLDLPFKCSIKGLSNPFGKSTFDKNIIHNLNNVNCKDKNAGLNNNKVKNKYTEKAYDTANCSKKAFESVSKLSDDLNKLKLVPNSENLNIAKSITKSVVNNKFDIGAASSMLTSGSTINNIAEAIQTSNSPIGNILKVGKETKILKDKNPVIDYAKGLSKDYKIANDTTSPIMKLAKSASLDSPVNVVNVTDKTLNAGQSLNLLGKAKAMNKKYDFVSSIRKYA